LLVIFFSVETPFTLMTSYINTESG